MPVAPSISSVLFTEIPLYNVHTCGLMHIPIPALLRQFRVVVRFIGVRTCVHANEPYVHKCTRFLSFSLLVPFSCTLEIVSNIVTASCKRSTVTRARHAIATTARCKLNYQLVYIREECGIIIAL